MSETSLPTILHALFAAIDANDYEAAANLYAEDALFVRPVPATPGAENGSRGREVLQGQQEIREYYVRRGPVSREHRITTYASSDGVCFIEGVVIEPEMSALFMCCAQVSDGKITRYTTTGTAASPEAIEKIVQTQRGREGK